MKFAAVLLPVLVMMGCGGSSGGSPSAPAPTPTPTPAPTPTPVPTPTPSIMLPVVNDVSIQTSAIERYSKFEMQVDVAAEYVNPYDLREVDLSATFTLPDGSQMQVPGFWDGESNWLVRLSPSLPGEWQYSLQVTDRRGVSNAAEGAFTVSDSTKKGWLQAGNQFNQDYSSRYLVHHDGSPFYGLGHGDVFSIFRMSDFVNETNRLVNNMNEAGENYVLWWPQFYFSPVEFSFEQYDVDNLKLIDGVLSIMEQENKFIIFTIWDHPQLRDGNHPWGEGSWRISNGFHRLLSSATEFFTSDEAWAWQVNMYRYMIARWGHHSSLAMWQTVSEIDGTNAFDNGNDWHKKVNDYFVDNDPYRHPTTASMAGDRKWDIGHNVMDLPQVHIYQDLLDSGDTSKALTVETAKVIADYTRGMWELEEKPNWIGEFGVLNSGANHYPELFHNAIWAALGSGAALTPAEWNDFNRWGVMTPEMKSHMRYLSEFVATTPLAQWDPLPITVTSTDPEIRGWGVAGEMGGLVWLQDYSSEGLDISQVRMQRTEKSSVSVNLMGMKAGDYRVFPFNTWSGEFSTSFDVPCDTEGCLISLPPFTDDIAFRIEAL